MLPINIFNNRLDFDIHISGNRHTDILYNGNTIIAGAREYCFNKVKQLISEIDNLGKKEIYFHIRPSEAINDSSGYECDVIYYREHLGLIKSQSKSYIEIKKEYFNRLS